MAEKLVLNNPKVDNLAIETGDVSAHEQGSFIDVGTTYLDCYLDGDDGVTRDLTAHNALFNVGKVDIDQSGATMTIQGGTGVSVVNRVDGARDVDIKQDDTQTYIKSQPGAGLTAVNYISNSGNYKQTMNNANVVIDGSSGGTVAHTVVGRGTTCHMEITNSTFVITSGRKKK